jgi:hypothetical protein
LPKTLAIVLQPAQLLGVVRLQAAVLGVSELSVSQLDDRDLASLKKTLDKDIVDCTSG